MSPLDGARCSPILSRSTGPCAKLGTKNLFVLLSERGAERGRKKEEKGGEGRGRKANTEQAGKTISGGPCLRFQFSLSEEWYKLAMEQRVILLHAVNHILPGGIKGFFFFFNTSYGKFHNINKRKKR